MADDDNTIDNGGDNAMDGANDDASMSAIAPGRWAPAAASSACIGRARFRPRNIAASSGTPAELPRRERGNSMSCRAT